MRTYEAKPVLSFINANRKEHDPPRMRAMRDKAGYEAYLTDGAKEVKGQLRAFNVNLKDPGEVLAVAWGGLRMVKFARRLQWSSIGKDNHSAVERAAMRVVTDSEAAPQESIGALQAYHAVLEGYPVHSPSNYSTDSLKYDISQLALFQGKLFEQISGVELE